HRVAAAFGVEAACLAVYDPIAATLEILHQTRARRAWELEVLMQAVAEERMAWVGEVVAVPILCTGGPSTGGRAGAERYPWGVLAIARPAADGPDHAEASSDRQVPGHAAGRVAANLERQRLRAVADCIAAEVERR